MSAIETSAVNGKAKDRSTAAPSKTPDPVGELRFRVALGHVEIGRFTECSGLSMEWDLQTYAEGGQNRFEHKLRGRIKYPNIVLKRGITHEDALLKWFFESQDREKRVAITVTLLGPGGKPVRQLRVCQCVSVKWTGPNFNAGSTGVAIETLELAHEGLVLGS